MPGAERAVKVAMKQGPAEHVLSIRHRCSCNPVRILTDPLATLATFGRSAGVPPSDDSPTTANTKTCRCSRRYQPNRSAAPILTSSKKGGDDFGIDG